MTELATIVGFGKCNTDPTSQVTIIYIALVSRQLYRDNTYGM